MFRNKGHNKNLATHLCPLHGGDGIADKHQVLLNLYPFIRDTAKHA
jgi:hypothetical protein